MRRISIVFIFLFLLCVPIALLACSEVTEPKNFTVMVANGEGYSISQSNIKSVEAGGTVSFEIELDDGYRFVNASFGEYSDSILTVNNVNFSMTIDFVVRLNESIADVKNGYIEIVNKNGGAVRYGEAADFIIIPNENYIVDEVFINGAASDFVRQASGAVTVSAVYDEFISITANCIGKECVIVSVISDEAQSGGNIVFSGVNDGVARYNDEIRIVCKPIEGYQLAYMIVNNKKFYGVSEMTLTVISDVSVSAFFIDQSYCTVLYDYNGGESLDDNPIDYFKRNQNIYLKNGVNCWKKVGYVLTSWNTKPDGSGERHALGAMMRMPNTDVVLYAQYKAETPDSDFEFSEYTGHGGVVGYEIVSYKGGKKDEVVLPSEHNGKKVLSIGSEAFANAAIGSVVTNTNIENIDARAFADMHVLTDLLLFDSLRNLSDDALSGCIALRKLHINSATDRIYDRLLETNIVDKQMRVKTSQGKKIVTLSGCSLAKGMHSELVLEDENLQDYDIIHMGVHARYGLSFLTSMVENYLNPGDIVVLALENYQHMWLTDEGLSLTNSESANRLQHLEANYDIYEEFDLIEQKYNVIIPALSKYFSQRASDIDNNITYNPNHNRYDMNEYGDYTYFRPNAESYGKFPQTESTLYLDMSFLDSFERINEWAEAQMEKGVHVCFIFPPIWRSPTFDEPDQVKLHDDFLTALKEIAIFPVLGSVDDAAFPYYCFDDWYNHMSTEGGYLYTAKFIELLSTAVKNGVV